MKPTYSFIVIAFNEASNIARTISSILNLESKDTYEILVVNDGSTDNTLRIVSDLAKNNKKIHVIDLQPNQGRGAARNAGIQAASGKYFALVDADIVLPKDWLTRCVAQMGEYEACGGVAVPDGDVSYVHRVCKLSPKAAPHTTTVTGSNGLFIADVFKKISFDSNKRNGEDVDLGFQIKKHGIKTQTVPGLLVDHLESKSFRETISWLFESGIGASRQLYEHPAVRIPDLAFLVFVMLVLVSSSAVAAHFISWWLALAAVICLLLASSTMHLHGKFHLFKQPLLSIFAVMINASVLLSYYAGRFVGVFTEWRHYGTR